MEIFPHFMPFINVQREYAVTCIEGFSSFIRLLP